MKQKNLTKTLSFILVAAIAFTIAACGGAAPTPETVTVVETVVVEKEVEVAVVETVIVEKEVEGEPVEVVVTATPEPAPDMSNEPVDLRFTVWTGSEAHLNMLNGIAAAYQEMHPNVSIQFDTIPFGDYISKLTLQLAGSNPPDAGWLLETSAPTFVNSGVLTDLKPVLDNPEYDYSDLSESATQLWVKDNTVLGVPFSTSPFIILYNKDLFETASVPTPEELLANGEWTWEKFAEVAQTISEATPDGVYGYDTIDGQGYETRNWHTLVPIIRSYGGDAWDTAGTTCLMNTPEAIEAVQLYHDMVYKTKGAVPPGEQADFYSGSAGMTTAQISRVSKLEDADFEWGLAPLPTGPAGYAPVIGQAAIVAFNASPNKDVAADFVAFMTNKENTATMAQFFPPIRASVLGSDALTEANPAIDPKQMQYVVDSIIDGTVLPSHPEFPKIDLAAKAEFDTLWMPDADVETTLNTLCETISPLLNN